MNNYDNREVKTYPNIARYIDRLFYSMKEVAPDVPVYLTVCFTAQTMNAWIKAFKAPYDGYAVWNICTTTANFKKVYSMLQRYGKPVIISGMFGYAPYKEKKSWYKVLPTISETNKKIEQAGFKGAIWLNLD